MSELFAFDYMSSIDHWVKRCSHSSHAKQCYSIATESASFDTIAPTETAKSIVLFSNISKIIVSEENLENDFKLRVK